MSARIEFQSIRPLRYGEEMTALGFSELERTRLFYCARQEKSEPEGKENRLSLWALVQYRSLSPIETKVGSEEADEQVLSFNSGKKFRCAFAGKDGCITRHAYPKL